MEIQQCILMLILLFGWINKAASQCTFQPPFKSSTWLDNTKGTLTFLDSTMTGWNLNIYNAPVDSWQCLDNSTTNYLILRSTNPVTIGSSTFYAYLCMKMTSITDYSYYYYLMFGEQPNADSERVNIKPSATLTGSEACDNTVTPPETAFHVLIQQGFEANAAVTCPDSLLFSGDYLYLNSDNTVDCSGATDVMDVCSSSTAVTFNYTTCSQRIAYSEGGLFYCVAGLTFGGHDYAVLYNRDSTVTVTEKTNNVVVNHDTQTTRFSCISSDGAKASVSPHICTSSQTPSAYPLLADASTVNGHLLVFNGTKYVTCPITTTTTTTTITTASAPSDSGGLSGGAIAAIVIVMLLLLVAVVVIIAIYFYLRSRKNKVWESENPMLERNGVQPRVVMVNETSKANKLSREKSTLSKDGTTLSREKSTLSREGTLISLKREKSNVSVKAYDKKAEKEEEEKKDTKPFLGLSFLSFCPCKGGGGKSVLEICRKGVCPCMRAGDKPFLTMCPCVKDSEPIVEGDIDKQGEKVKGKEPTPSKGPAVKGSKIGPKDKKGSKTKADKTKAGKSGKDKNKKDQSNTETQTEKSTVKSKENLTKSDIIIVNTPRPGSASKGVETITAEPTEKKGDKKSKSEKTSKKKKGKSDKKETEDQTDTEKEDILASLPLQEKSKLFREKTDVSGVSSVRRPGTPVSLAGINSTIKHDQNGAAPPKATKKSRFLDWNFLVCLQGNRSPEPKEEPETEKAPEQETVKTSPRKTQKGKGLKGKKGEKKSGAKAGKKGAEKNKKDEEKKTKEPKTTADDESENKGHGKAADIKLLNSEKPPKPQNNAELPSVERSKSLPLRREETTVTLQDGKIAVDVYVPDETSTLKLNDTVRVVKDKDGKGDEKTITKSKTTLGTTKPDPSKELTWRGKPEKSEDKKTKPKQESANKAKKQTGSKLGKSDSKKSGAAKKTKKKK